MHYTCAPAGKERQRDLCSLPHFQTELPLHSLVVMSARHLEQISRSWRNDVCLAWKQPRPLLGSRPKECFMRWNRWLQTSIIASFRLFPQPPCKLGKNKARTSPPPGRTDHSSPSLHNSSRKTVYFSNKPVTSLPAERPGKTADSTISSWLSLSYPCKPKKLKFPP